MPPSLQTVYIKIRGLLNDSLCGPTLSHPLATALNGTIHAALSPPRPRVPVVGCAGCLWCCLSFSVSSFVCLLVLSLVFPPLFVLRLFVVGCVCVCVCLCLRIWYHSRQARTSRLVLIYIYCPPLLLSKGSPCGLGAVEIYTK